MASKSHYRSQIKSTESEINSLQTRLSAAQRKRNQIDDVIDEIEAREGAQQRVVNGYISQINDVDSKIRAAETESSNQRSNIEGKVTSTVETLRQRLMDDIGDAQHIELGDSAEANRVEKLLNQQWSENQELITETENKLADNCNYQLDLRNAIDGLQSILAGAPIKFKSGADEISGVRKLVRALEAEHQRRTDLGKMAATYINQFAHICAGIRHSMTANDSKKEEIYAGDRALFLQDERNMFGALKYKQLQELEQSLIDKGIDRRVVRAYSLLGINQDWQTSNDADYMIFDRDHQGRELFEANSLFIQRIEQRNGRFLTGIRDYMALWLYSANPHELMYLDTDGYVLSDGKIEDLHIKMNVTLTTWENVQFFTAKSWVGDRGRQFVQAKANVTELGAYLKELDETKKKIISEQEKLYAIIDDLQEKIAGEVNLDIVGQVGQLSGRVTLSRAREEKDRLEREITENQSKLEEAIRNEQEISGYLAEQKSATGSVDYGDAVKIFKDYISAMVRNFDEAPSDVAALAPAIKGALTAADGYIDSCEEIINAQQALIGGYQRERKDYASHRDKEQNKLDKISREKSGPESRLRSENSDISEIELKISTLQSNISSYQSSIRTIERKERMSTSSSTSSYRSLGTTGGGSFRSMSSSGGSGRSL